MQKCYVLSLIASSPSSLYSPKFSLPLNLDTLSRRYKPTSPQISAPSKLLTITSNNVRLLSLPNSRNELSDLSCNEKEHEKAKPLYETALNESG